MVSIPKEVMDLLKPTEAGDIYKAMATVSAEGIPNVAPMGSIFVMDSETIMFGDMAQVHTRENLEGKNKRVVIAIWKAPLTAYQVKGTFVGYQNSGQLFDFFAKAVAERAAKAGVPVPPLRAVGLVAVDEVYSSTPGWNSKKLA